MEFKNQDAIRGQYLRDQSAKTAFGGYWISNSKPEKDRKRNRQGEIEREITRDTDVQTDRQ